VLQVAVACASSRANAYGEQDFAVILLEIELGKNIKITEVFGQENRRKIV